MQQTAVQSEQNSRRYDTLKLRGAKNKISRKTSLKFLNFFFSISLKKNMVIWWILAVYGEISRGIRWCKFQIDISSCSAANLAKQFKEIMILILWAPLTISKWKLSTWMLRSDKTSKQLGNGLKMFLRHHRINFHQKVIFDKNQLFNLFLRFSRNSVFHLKGRFLVARHI